MTTQAANKQPLTPFDMATLAANAAESKKASETTLLDTGRVSTLADYFVICSADSSVQIKTITDAIVSELRQHGQHPLGIERDASGKWSLIDFGDILVHVMHRQTRHFYQIEAFWSHASTVSRDRWAIPQAS